jgi:hypothetical protein
VIGAKKRVKGVLLGLSSGKFSHEIIVIFGDFRLEK